MLVRIAAAVIACLAVAGVGGCAQSEETCVVQDKAGKWNVGGVTACEMT